MRPALLVVALLGVLLSGLVPSLDAAVITFDEATGDLFDQLDEGGFRLECESAFFVGNSTFCSPDCPDNGTRYAMPQDGWVAMRIRTASGVPFAFLGLDAGEGFVIFPGPSQLLIRGHRTDGTTAEQLVALDQVNDGTGPLVDFQSVVASSGFEQLDLLEIVVPPPNYQGWHRYSLDNILVEPRGPVEIPTLSSAGGVLLAAFLLFLAWRRLHFRALPR